MLTKTGQNRERVEKVVCFFSKLQETPERMVPGGGVQPTKN